MALIQLFGGKMLGKPTSSKEIGWYRNSARKRFGAYQLSMLIFSSISQKKKSSHLNRSFLWMKLSPPA